MCVCVCESRYQHFTDEQWMHVQFSDEKKFTVDSESGRVYRQRPVSTRYGMNSESAVDLINQLVLSLPH